MSIFSSLQSRRISPCFVDCLRFAVLDWLCLLYKGCYWLQQAYFKCAYECFDRSRKQEEISSCVEHCSVPVVRAQQHFENEMAKFQVSLFLSNLFLSSLFALLKPSSILCHVSVPSLSLSSIAVYKLII